MIIAKVTLESSNGQVITYEGTAGAIMISKNGGEETIYDAASTNWGEVVTMIATALYTVGQTDHRLATAAVLAYLSKSQRVIEMSNDSIVEMIESLRKEPINK